MADDTRLWRLILDALTAARPVLLAVVVASKGSAPARVGSKMAVTLDNASGTLGGGLIEQHMLQKARAMLVQGEPESWIQHFRHHSHPDQSDDHMWCGGEQTVLLYRCRQTDLATLRQIVAVGESRQWLGYGIDASGLHINDDELFNDAPLWTGGEHWQYQEKLCLPPRAYIVGAGHVGQALAQLLSWLDFDVVLLDCREFNASEPIDGKQAWLRVDYLTIDQVIPEGEDVFVFVMTHCHAYDQAVIARLANRSFAYLGLLGSQTKVNRIKAALSACIDAAFLEKLHAPMGLAIASHTPQEIAVSIAAEVVGLWARRSGGD